MRRVLLSTTSLLSAQHQRRRSVCTPVGGEGRGSRHAYDRSAVSRARHMALAAVSLSALAIFVSGVGGALWLEILALAAAGIVWFRYRWNTGIREQVGAAGEGGLARGTAERGEGEGRKRRREPP